ncbi:hypothetical protein GON26_20600 [Flavobacterium sp. GA093]|uniref:Uncharacterized protein n=1 Tax=Flavobacterium hydrocarbonoxydans TaxID=2683249 RepID=A0A6I4NYD4_9FLAO|nr:hypothetical protein [Flavobacterium hydrocarbonoxydans]MWB96769.1 hypothetical protein [Flavobacterium hydrocarbonoxydans]
MATNINTILSWFKTGLKPTQAQFWASWQSFWHKDEQIPQSNITDLTSTLNAKAEKSQLEGHNHDPNAHEEAIGEKLDKGGYTGTAKDIDERIAAIENPDRVLKFGTINIAGLAITIEANAFAWVLNKVTYLIPDAFTETIPAATAGMYRNDILVGNQFGQYSIIEGIEAANGEAAAEPAVPTGTIKLGFISVFGTAIASFGSTPSIEKTTMVDADRIVIDDSADSFSKKSVKWVSIKTSLKTWFDTIYLTQNSNQEVSGVKTFLAGKLGLRNAANTFTSFFANSNTAARTYTLQNRNGIIADNTDLATKQSTFTGIANYIVKSLDSSTLISSRLFDNGTFFGIGTYRTPVKDFTLGNQTNREIGVENSENTTKGRDLIISAGKTINFIIDSSFVKISPSVGFPSYDMTASSNNVYACNASKIFKQSGGTGPFLDIGIVTRNYRAITSTITNDIYVSVKDGDIYKQINESGSFVALGQTPRNYTGMCSSPNGDVYASVSNGDIYKQTGGNGDFLPLDQTIRTWGRMAAAPNGDIFALDSSSIYKQLGGVGDFIFYKTGAYGGIVIAPNNNLYAAIGINIYMQTNSDGAFNLTDSVLAPIWGMASFVNGNIYAGDYSNNIYVQQNSDTGIPNLDGGTLKLKSGTGKGNAQSKIEFITGQKLSSGTDMQIETLRGFIDENGHMIWTNMPTFSDNSAALAGGLPVGCEYKTATGDRKIVY